jgi:hypothetical protein
MSYEQIGIPPEDAQFLETRKFNVSEIARWFGVPPHKLMEMTQATFSNIEHQNIEFVTDAIMSWVKRFEVEANIKLISAANPRIKTKMNINGLLRGDSAARGEWYTKMSNLGVYTVNDIRELEDMNPIGTDGDKHLVQMNLTTLEKVGEESETNTETGTVTPEVEESEQAGAPGTEVDAKTTTAQTILAEAFGRIVAREDRRITDALKKYDGDFPGLQKFLDKFCADHEKYMARTLAVPVAAFDIKIDIDQFVADHIEITKQLIASASWEPAPPEQLAHELMGIH